MRKLALAISVCLAAFSLPVMAGGQATIVSSGGEGPSTVVVKWRDSDKVRIQPQGQPGYMLLLDGKPYSVTNVQGQSMVMDMSSMGQMAGQQSGGKSAPEIGPEHATKLLSMEETGRTETIAGIEGSVYEVTWQDANGKQHTDEAVLSDDETVASMSRAFMNFAKASDIGSETEDPDAIGKELRDRGLGVLRFTDGYRVEKISGDTPPAGEFELPAEPMSMQEMMGNMMKQRGQ